ncbi:MAG: heavy-metal-associated domain-containing protein, partial [Steroidobacteraceae bacterium]
MATLRARIAGMDCGSCALTIEDGLRQLPGVRRVSVDFTTETLEVEGEVARAQVEHRLRQLGYQLAQPGASGPAALPSGATSGSAGFLKFALSEPQQRLALAATGAVLLITVLATLTVTPGASTLLSWTLAFAVVLVG